MENTEGLTLRLTKHARTQMEAKGFKRENIDKMFSKPDRVYPNRKFPGQFRVAGKGICLIGKPVGETFLVFTVYEDGVMTPPRKDQLDTPEGKAYAELYEKAKASGKVRRSNEYWPRVHERRGDIGHTLIK
ncbi:hypothetical protein SEA_FAUST_226 [Streptomyces phage Faust]|uniref:DUF4258 domain-containing protein n=1 Tax=Streptomyces phage Faust TaxID=2767565 RepID=A0A7G9UZ43_9CAUD|nr:hypothetical protein PP456_gp061 [Streptomyces phage Faust]QNN99298.1 hypothetical protein SEA_FAUST_226 [Streptomyces phage Faust]